MNTKIQILINVNIDCHALIWMYMMNLLKTNPPPLLINTLYCHPDFSALFSYTSVHINQHELLRSFDSTFIVSFIKVLFQEFVAIIFFSFERYYLYTTHVFLQYDDARCISFVLFSGTLCFDMLLLSVTQWGILILINHDYIFN